MPRIFSSFIMKVQPKLFIASLSIGLVSFAFAQDVLIGDINGDNKVDRDDIQAVAAHIIQQMQLSGQALEFADVNDDSSIDVADLVALINKVLNPEPPDTPQTPVIPEIPESPLYVDLGLKDSDGHPILWATRNIGAEQPNDYGGLYAWAETSSKSVYSWGTYKWITDGHINKYYIGDGITRLEDADDIARSSWGEDWRMPTAQEMAMLVTDCSHRWCANGNETYEGVAGVEFTGPNGNTLFLPAAGYNPSNGQIEQDNWCIYWTSTRREEDHSDAFKFAYSVSGPSSNPYAKRYEGRSIRPIYIYTEPQVPVDPDSPDNPDNTEPDQPGNIDPEIPDTPDQPENPDKPNDPEPEQPDQPDQPDQNEPDNPEETDQPDNPDEPSIPDTPDDPDSPNSPDPEQPDASDSELPDTPDQPTPSLPTRPFIDLGITDANGNVVLWATCNVGATNPQEYGDLYSWGYTKESAIPIWDSYKWGTQENLTKYNDSDSLVFLESTDDVATVLWGEKWQIPTYEHINLLKTLCSFHWYNTTDSPYPGVAGVLVTGPNGNTIFLPGAGYHDGKFTNKPSNQNEYAIYWTNERLLDSPDKAYMFSYSSQNSFSSSICAFRYQARSIRPVFVISSDETTPGQPDIEDPGEPDDEPEQPGTDNPENPDTPENPDNTDPEEPNQPDQPDLPNPDDPEQPEQPGGENPDQPDQPGIDNPDNPENPDIPNPDQPDSNEPEEPDVPDEPNVPEEPDQPGPEEPDTPTQNLHTYVDLGQVTAEGHPVLWATCNVGAEAEYEYGGLYAWGETQTRSEYHWYNYTMGRENALTKYNASDKLCQLEPIDDVATQLWGEEWHTPTAEDILFLENRCSFTWMPEGNNEYNGVIGVKITGPNGNSIFLPAAGYHDGATASQQGRYGIYWSSTRSTSTPSMARMFAYSGHHNLSKDGYAFRYQARSVRPVRIDYETTIPVTPDQPDTPVTPDTPDKPDKPEPVIPEVDPTPVQPENTFLLENDRVYHFVRDFQYTSDYSYTKLPEFCDTTYTIGKHQDWPRGVTLGEATYYNLVPGRIYKLKRVEKGKQTEVTIKTTGQVRTIKMEGIDNVRDLGGWASSINGKHVRYERLYRGTELTTNQKDIHYLDSIGSRHEITNNDRKVLLETMGVRAELDFRAYDEKPNNFKRSSALGSDIAYHECYLDYHDIVFNYPDNKERLRLAFQFVLKELREDKAVYFHCVWGSDRTGIFSAMILGLIGVSNSDIDKEFELSSFSNHLRLRYKCDKHKFATQYLIQEVKHQTGATLADKFKNWWLTTGVTEDEIEEFRMLMLE